MKSRIKLILLLVFFTTCFSLQAQDYRDAVVGRYDGQMREKFDDGTSSNWASYAMWVQKSPHSIDKIRVSPNKRTESELQTIPDYNFSPLDSITLEYGDNLQYGQFYSSDSLFDRFRIIAGGGNSGWREFYGKKQGASSVVEYRAEVLSVFPNPAQTRLYVLNLGATYNTIYCIYNANWKMVLQGRLTSEGIDVSQLPKGLYLLTVFTNDKTVAAKVVVE